MNIKGKILKTAFKLFIERGFLEVYITDIGKEMNIDIREVYKYFKNRNEIMHELIEKFWLPHINNVITADKCFNTSERKLSIIFEKYAEVEVCLKENFNINKFNYNSIMFLTGKVVNSYTSIPELIIHLNDRLVKKIESIVKEGKKLGEILNTVNSKSISNYILSLLQSNLALWVMNQNINIKDLFETSFKYLWNSIKAS